MIMGAGFRCSRGNEKGRKEGNCNKNGVNHPIQLASLNKAIPTAVHLLVMRVEEVVELVLHLA